MPKPHSVKTVSALKGVSSKKLSLAVLLLVIGLVITLAIIGSRSSPKVSKGPSLCVNRQLTQVAAKGCDRPVEIASTPEARTKGLSGREASTNGEAMLFDFNTTGNYCIWMKDMKFALDIAWIDKDGKVTSLVQNISPDTYPKQYCHQGLYVLEVTAGRAQELGIALGIVLDL